MFLITDSMLNKIQIKLKTYIHKYVWLIYWFAFSVTLSLQLQKLYLNRVEWDVKIVMNNQS
jgi:hypothetical protein